MNTGTVQLCLLPLSCPRPVGNNLKVYPAEGAGARSRFLGARLSRGLALLYLITQSGLHCCLPFSSLFPLPHSCFSGGGRGSPGAVPAVLVAGQAHLRQLPGDRVRSRPFLGRWVFLAPRHDILIVCLSFVGASKTLHCCNIRLPALLRVKFLSKVGTPPTFATAYHDYTNSSDRAPITSDYNINSSIGTINISPQGSTNT